MFSKYSVVGWVERVLCMEYVGLVFHALSVFFYISMVSVAVGIINYL